MATLYTKTTNSWKRLHCPHSPIDLASLQKVFVYSWIRILCICSKETNRSPGKGLDFPQGTDPQGWHYWPSNREGCWGLITERETYKCCFIAQFLSNLTTAGWKVLVSFKKSWVVCFVLFRSFGISSLQSHDYIGQDDSTWLDTFQWKSTIPY